MSVRAPAYASDPLERAHCSTGVCTRHMGRCWHAPPQMQALLPVMPSSPRTCHAPARRRLPHVARGSSRQHSATASSGRLQRACDVREQRRGGWASPCAPMRPIPARKHGSESWGATCVVSCVRQLTASSERISPVCSSA
ncbi:hypothetical protein T492DRAFT_1065202 [Pavlovales sp. CCMP2436]|nr:hypothetical protein T492DRAFT_1065202 [Pavlovales sp. CCMP2436]